MDEFPIEGDWWLAENPEKVLPGTLTYSEDEGAELALIGTFGEPGDPHPPIRQVILGRGLNRSQITLLDCMGAGSHWGSSGLARESYHSPLVLLGGHFSREPEAAFLEFYVGFDHMNAWADFRAIEHNQNDGVIQVRIDFDKLSSLELFETESFAMKLFAGMDSNPNWYSFAATQSTRIGFHFKKPIVLSDFWPILRDAQNLFTILVGESIFYSEVSAVTAGKDRRIDIRRRLATHPPPRADFHPMDVLLPYQKIKDRASRLLANWFQKSTQLRPVQNLALVSVYNDNLYLESRFLSTVQALESYHRRTKPGLEVPAEQHKARLAAVLDSVPDDYKDWARMKLGHSNEFGLEKRLQTLIDQFPKFRELIEKRVPGFVRRVVHSRHYLTHFDDKNRADAFKDIELFFPSEKLRILFWMCMLTELGLSSEEAEQTILAHTRFSAVLRFN